MEDNRPGLPDTPAAEPLRATLSDADDRVRLDHWMAPQPAIVPRIRIGRRWLSVVAAIAARPQYVFHALHHAGRLWTAKDDSVTLPTWLGIPGLRHTLGLARWWHFSINLLWLLNGVAFYILLFSTDSGKGSYL